MLYPWTIPTYHTDLLLPRPPSCCSPPLVEPTPSQTPLLASCCCYRSSPIAQLVTVGDLTIDAIDNEMPTSQSWRRRGPTSGWVGVQPIYLQHGGFMSDEIELVRVFDGYGDDRKFVCVEHW